MNAKRKEAAIKAYEAIPVEELEASLQADEKGYTPDEIAEIIEGIKAKGGSQGKAPEQPKAKPAAKNARPLSNGYEYPEFDLWKVDPEFKSTDSKGDSKLVSFTAIKIVRSAVKLEASAAEQLNTQSHNNLRRYYPAGSIVAGNEEKDVLIR